MPQIDPGVDPRRHVQDWLNRLSAIIPKSLELTDLAAKIDQLADMLVAKVPIDLFDSDSLEFCARRFKFFPGYAELWGRLQTYQRERPKLLKALPASMPGFDDPTLTREDQIHLRVWLTQRGEGFTHIAGREFRDRMAVSLDVLRTKALLARVYRYVVRTDTDAASIALQRGWETGTERPAERSPEEIAAAGRSTAAAVSALRARGPGREVSQDEAIRAATAHDPPAPAPIERTRADDVALLTNLRGNPAAPNRAARIARLCESLGTPRLATDPDPPRPAPVAPAPTAPDTVPAAAWRAPWADVAGDAP